MKFIKILPITILLFIGLNSFAQKESKFTEINFRVEGVCGMCESRIENALDIKGIKLADWDVKTKNCRVIYKTADFKELDIHQIVADLGHTTEKVKTTPENYDNLHHCCKY